MNCPSRVDGDCLENDGWNQNPPDLAADLTTRSDLGSISNARIRRGHRIDPSDPSQEDLADSLQLANPPTQSRGVGAHSEGKTESIALEQRVSPSLIAPGEGAEADAAGGGSAPAKAWSGTTLVEDAGRKCLRVLSKYAKFIGPGFMVSVAYIDPGE